MGLTMEQIAEHQPPASAAKRGSSRIQSYYDATGTDEAWELDALKPAVIQKLIVDEVHKIRDADLWEQAVEKEAEGEAMMERIAANYGAIVDFLDDLEGEDDDDY